MYGPTRGAVALLLGLLHRADSLAIVKHYFACSLWGFVFCISVVWDELVLRGITMLTSGGCRVHRVHAAHVNPRHEEHSAITEAVDG